MTRCDIAIIGAGIAGLGLAFALRGEGAVVVIEREAQAGRHASARSTATLVESYGGPIIGALTTASRPFFAAPPPGFAPLAAPRGNLRIGRSEDRARLEAELDACRARIPDLRLVGAPEARALCPALRPEAAMLGLFEPGARDLDVESLQAGLQDAAARAGITFRFATEVCRGARENGQWRLVLKDGATLRAEVVVNAAGAWADALALACGVDPLGLVPLRRTVAVVPAPAAAAAWPLVRDAHESFYFKPGPDGLMVTPCDETPAPPNDPQPEPADIARAQARLEAATSLRAAPVLRAWAGLRSFLSDRLPAVGFDPTAPGFFWLAGQGGYGLQTAPALSRLAAARLLGRPAPDDLAPLAPGLAPDRFRPA